MWTGLFLLFALAAGPGDVVIVFHQTACGTPNIHTNGCYGTNNVPVTLCRRSNATCENTEQMVVTDLSSHTDPFSGCHLFEWTWTCALDYRACFDGQVCVCANNTVVDCNCNITLIYNGTEPCTSAPTLAPTSPTATPTSSPTLVLTFAPTSIPTLVPTLAPTTLNPTTTLAPTSISPTPSPSSPETLDNSDKSVWILVACLVGATLVLIFFVACCLVYRQEENRNNRRAVAPRSHVNHVYGNKHSV